MGPSRKKGGGGKAAAAASARREWKVGDLVLAKVKGFPAWPAMILAHGIKGETFQKPTEDSSGKEVDLSIYQGKVLLVVNVASKCGFTEFNYKQLTELYRNYRDEGFEILAFPCNQFLYQEPATSQEVHQFACTRFKAEYPVFQKVRVNGQNTAPVYKFLKSKKPTFLGTRIRWNFTKFLVGKDGQVIDRYGPTVPPLSIQKDIKKALGETPELPTINNP